MNQKTQPNLSYLFLKFLKIGSISFGGFMALVSIVQKELVEKDKIIDNDELLDGLSLATVLPGPMAVNVIAYLGYRLRGLAGGLVSMFAVILPSFLLILALSWVYFTYGNIPEFQRFFDGVLPAVAAIILSVSIQMSKKNLKDKKQAIMAIIAFILILWAGGFFITLSIVLGGAIAGYLIYRPSRTGTYDKPGERKMSGELYGWAKKRGWIFPALLIFILIIYLLPLLLDLDPVLETIHSLFVTIGSVSVTLFGGGYVFIPMLQELVVNKMHWLSNQEFIDGIAMGQITPGPIMISATFIGYKLAGIPGAIAGTIAIFLPPGILIMLASHILGYIKGSPHLKAVFMGIHPAVIGMIFAASLIIGMSMPHEWLQFIILAASFILAYRFKVDILIIIPLSGLAGLLFA
ncbi:MAG: chromate efflux transporter [Cyclobacteriaceae bacterium]|nr:chromate efflux transporter [Cyclobacteriaceae bacterium]